jgi:Zn-dependent peptidase ImmA (M78 family)
MASIKILESIGQALIEKNGIRNYTLFIVDEITNSSVISHIDKLNPTNNYYRFKIGHSSYYGDFDEILDFVHKKYPITKNINPFVVVLLHEIAHVLDNVNPPTPRDFFTTEQYREFPREKAADMFAENFIWNHPKLCGELSKMADKAIEEFWNDQ